MRRLKLILVFLLLAALALAAPRSRLKPGFNMFSKQQDVELGKEAATEISQQVTIIHDPELAGYLDRLGRKLAVQRDAGDYPYTFKLVHDQSINAFALPGGPTFVHTGLVLAAENEAELAGVMAHEISHVALRHGTNQVTKAMGFQILMGVVGGAVGDESLWRQLVQAGAGFGAGSILLKYSRDAERQADLLGAYIMAGAGYDPVEMARFFEKLQAGGGSRGPEFFSSHPKPGNRVKYVEDEIRGMRRPAYSLDNAEFLRFRDRVRALGDPPAKPKPPERSRAR